MQLSPPRPTLSSPRTSCAAGTRSDPRLQQTKLRSPFRHLQLSARRWEPFAKLSSSSAHAWPLDFSRPCPRRPRLPRSPPLGAARPSGWQLTPLSGPPPRSATMLLRGILLAVQGKAWTRCVRVWGSGWRRGCRGRSRDPLPLLLLQ